MIQAWVLVGAVWNACSGCLSGRGGRRARGHLGTAGRKNAAFVLWIEVPTRVFQNGEHLQDDLFCCCLSFRHLKPHNVQCEESKGLKWAWGCWHDPSFPLAPDLHHSQNLYTSTPARKASFLQLHQPFSGSSVFAFFINPTSFVHWGLLTALALARRGFRKAGRPPWPGLIIRETVGTLVRRLARRLSSLQAKTDVFRQQIQGSQKDASFFFNHHLILPSPPPRCL